MKTEKVKRTLKKMTNLLKNTLTYCYSGEKIKAVVFISLNIQRNVLDVENLEELVTLQSLWFWLMLHITHKCWFEMQKRAIKLQIYIKFSCYTSLIKPDFTRCELLFMVTATLNVSLRVLGVSQFCLIAQSSSSVSPSLYAFFSPSPTLMFIMFPAVPHE